MKLSRIFSVIMFVTLSAGLNAQLFVGGNIGLSTHSRKTENTGVTTSNDNGYNLNLSPYIGKFLSEDFAAGFGLNINFSSNTSGVNIKNVDKSSAFGGSIFARYYAVKWNKFSVFGQGNISFSFASESSETGGVKTNGPKSTTFSLTVYPGMSYDLNDKLSLLTTINVLSLGYTNITEKNANTNYKENNSSFNIGAGLTNIVSIGSISVGAIYKF